MEDMTTYLIKYKSDTTELKRARTITEELAKEVQNTEEQYKELGVAQQNTNKEIINTTRKAKNETENFSSSIKKLAAGYMTFATIKSAIDTFSKFDDQLKRTQALTGATGMELMQLEKQSKDLGKSTAFSASEVAQAQGNMGQSGLKVNEILAATPGVLSLASASQIDLASATDITVSSLNLFNLGADKATKVADILAKAQATSAGNTQWFGMALQNSAANANQLGYDVEQTVAILSTMAPAFKDGGSAGTSLNAILRDLTKSMDKNGYATINNQKVMLARNGKMLGMADIIKNVSKATDGLSDVQRRQALTTILGDEAIRGFNTLLSQGSDKITEYDTSLRGANGTAATMSEILESGLGGSLREMKSMIEGATISITEAFLPAIEFCVDTVTGFFSIASSVAELFKEYPGIMWTITGALSAYTLSLKAISFWNTVVNATNPFGWVKLAITGVIIALSYLEKKFGVVSKGLKLISKGFGAVKSFFGLEDETATDATIEVNKQENTVPDVPGFAKGTDSAPGGIALVGENGPELVNLTKGAQVIPTEETKELLNSKKILSTVHGDTYHINITGGENEELLDKLLDELDRRDRRKRARVMAILGGV